MGRPGPEAGQSQAPPPPAPGPASAGEELGEEELQARMAELRKELVDAPAELVVANHCYGLFELAALHLSADPPQLPKARLAIDAIAALVEGLAGRLGEQETQLRESLASLRMAYVQLQAGAGEPSSPG